MAINVSDIAIRIGAIYNGQNAFKQAEKATRKLEANVKSLGRSFGVAFGGASLAYAVKSSVQAFATAEKELSSLRNTVKNLGLEFAQTDIEDYIKKIGRLYGVTGSQAVPAMQSLLTATGDVSASMSIFNTALDLAYSRNKDVSEVAQDLANAYVGNTKALNAYNLGLTKAEIASMSFNELMAEIGKQTKGAATEGTKTFANQLAILTETSNQAKEVIGKSLVEAMASLSGKEGANGAATTITKLANGISKTVEGITYLVKKISWAKPIIVAAGIAIMAAWAPWFTAISAAVVAIGWLGNKLKGTQLDASKIGTGKSYFAVQAERLKAEKAKAKAEAEAKKRAAELLATQRKITLEKLNQAKLDKAALALGKAQSVFDLEKIQLEAASKKATGDDLLRIKLKQEILALEDAIQAKNGDLATKLAETVTSDAARLANLIKQNAELDKMVKSYDSIISKEVVINFTSTGLGAILNATGGLTGRGNVVIPNETGGSSSSSSSASSSSSSASSAAAAAAAAASSSAATTVAETVTTVTDVLGDLITQTDVLTKDAKDAVDAIATLTQDSTSLANATTVPADSIGSGFIDWLMTQSAQGKQDPPPVTVTITENAKNLIDVVVNGLQEQSASGINTRVIRNTGGLNW